MTFSKFKKMIIEKYKEEYLEDKDTNIIEYLTTEDEKMLKEICKLSTNDIDKKTYLILTNELYGYYPYCDGIQELKFNIYLDVIEYELIGEKYTFKQLVKKAIKES